MGTKITLEVRQAVIGGSNDVKGEDTAQRLDLVLGATSIEIGGVTGRASGEITASIWDPKGELKPGDVLEVATGPSKSRKRSPAGGSRGARSRSKSRATPKKK